MKLGLVTYMWGADWDLPTLLDNCRASGFEGVELRSTHAHGVEITLDDSQRRDVARRFADSGVTLVGLGSACEYHSPEPAELARNIEETKAFIELCHDCGGGGVKVRPNGLLAKVPIRQTLEQIGHALREVAEYGAGYGVEIRLEVHGNGTKMLPNIKQIMDVADHPNAKVCWNCNAEDLAGRGLEYNFRLVQDRMGTVHIHDLNTDYPWRDLFALLNGSGFDGWTLLEDNDVPQDPVRVMKYYRRLWDAWTAS